MLLKSGLQHDGVWVHTASDDEFVTLQFSYASTEREAIPNDVCDNITEWIRIDVGLREHSMWIPVSSDARIASIPVFKHEQVWLATSSLAPRRLCVYGHTSRMRKEDD